MGSFRRGIRFFRSQEVICESRPSLFRKNVPITNDLLISCFVIPLISFIFNWFIGLILFKNQLFNEWGVLQAFGDHPYAGNS